MKRNVLKVIGMVFISISLVSCGMGSANSLASSNLGGTSQSTSASGNSLASGLLGGALSGNSGTGLLGSVLSNLLGNKTSESSLVGTWTYSAPKVVFESESVLAKVGGAVASNKVESTLSKYLEKIGMKAGKSQLTLNEDKTCTFNYNGKTANGTYSYDASSSKMTITGALGVSSMICTVTVSGNELYMLFDADKLLTIMTGLGSSLSSTSTISSLLKNYNGLQLGWTMKR